MTDGKNLPHFESNFCHISYVKLSAYTLLEAPFIYALCMEEHGKEFINSVVGQETSGGQYNKISLDSKRRPHNPMINTGQDSGNFSV